MTTTITPISGWLLHVAATLDAASPGLLGHLVRCSAERRHVLASYLSRKAPARAFASDTDLVAFLMAASHDEVLSAAYGSVPSGLRRALARAGDSPHQRRFYTYLYMILATDVRAEMHVLIQQLQRVTPRSLRIARLLPATARQAHIVEVLEEERDARDVGRFIRLLADAGIDQSSLLSALTAVPSHRHIGAWARRWAAKLALPPHPVPASDGYDPIRTARDLEGMARRFRNCTRNYLSNVLEHRSSFATVTVGEASAVVHLVNAGGRWMLDDIYGPANQIPDDVVVDHATRHLQQYGIYSREDHSRASRKWECLRRLTRTFGFEN